jgi:hypothetical protein
VETKQPPELVSRDVTEARLAIASRYLGPKLGRAFAQQRKPGGTIVRFELSGARMWDLTGILPGVP